MKMKENFMRIAPKMIVLFSSTTNKYIIKNYSLATNEKNKIRNENL